ncbi:MAG: hypothetical protein RJB65_2248 [Actinomycetota bacterium]|jgi:flagellar biosynthesis protein FliP
MPGNPFTDPRWATQLADTVERVTARIRSVATDNAVKASRAIVFGVLVLLTVMAATPLAVILFTRFLQIVLSRIIRTDHGTTVWVSYLVAGVVFYVLGVVMLKMRHRKDPA